MGVYEANIRGNPPKKNKTSLMAGQRRFVLISIAPILILFMVFNFVPIFLSLILAFYNYSPLSMNSPFIGLQNFVNLLSDEVFNKSLFNTLKFVVFATGINLILATAIAVVINSIIKRSLKNFFRTLYFLPTIAPLVAVSIIWATLLDPNYGIVNMMLSLFNQHTMIYWLNTDQLALPSIIAVTLWADLGYNIVIIMAGLDAIPRMFYEASCIDGANRLQVFWKITLPLLTRTLLFVSVMTVISYFQVFTQVQLMTNGGPDHSSEVIALTIYNNAFRFMKMGYASSMAIILLVIILIVSALQLKFAKVDWEY